MDYVILATTCTLGILLSLWVGSKKKVETFISPQSMLVIKKLKGILKHILNPKYKFKGVLKPLNSRRLMNEIIIKEGNQSKTIDKFEIFLCLKDRNNVYYDTNSLLYVLLHEISHVICNELHHTDKFISIFEALLDHAADLGYYNKSLPFTQNYCPQADDEE